jgi:ABC-type phosphate transport system substrate-binding protein
MRHSIRLLIAAVVLAMVAPLHTLRAQDYKVVVNSATSVASMSKADVARLFLKQDTRWKDGKAVAVVDLPPASAVRQGFSKTVLGKDVGSVNSYWQQQVFSGRASPPVVKQSDADVVAYVAATPGAVGYVSADAAAAGVKTLTVTP